MNHHLVPDFVHSSTASGRGSDGDGGGGVSCLRKSQMDDDDDIMELVWRDGQVVMQRQNQRTVGKKSSPLKIGIGDAELHSATPPAIEDVSNAHHRLFTQEDEMASWLHYPLEDNTAAASCFEWDLCTNFICPPPPVTVTTTSAAAANVDAHSSAAAVEVKLTHTLVTEAGRPPVPPPNFVHFSRTRNARAESGPPDSYRDDRRQSTTVVDSSVNPATEHDFGVSHILRTTDGGIGNHNTIDSTTYVGSMSCDAIASTSSAGRDMNTYDVMVISSPGGSAAGISASVKPTITHKLQAVSRKRKAREQAADEAECYSEDAEFEPANAKKPARGSTSAKRSRVAEVHNLSERKRRDRINEKMKALLALIPHCNKADKASMLDEAIEFIKSLQLQVQMMSMGCSIVPMMFPGGQHYMPPMGMGMGMNQPMVPYPHVFAGSPIQNPSTSSRMGPRFSKPAYHHMHPVPPPDLSRLQTTNQPVPPVFAGSPMQNPCTSSHTGPRFPMPAYHMQPVPLPDLSRLQTTNQKDPTLASQSLSQPQLSNLCDPHQYSLGPHQMHLQTHQNQAMTQPNTTKQNTTTTETEFLGHRKSG